MMKLAAPLTLLFAAACGSHGGGASPDGGSAALDAPTQDAATCGQPAPGAAAERVVTTSGTVHGAQVGSGAAFAYLDVPFAQPPIGALRFAAPQPAQCASAEVDATTYGPECAQLGSDGASIDGSEDCLQLNVWAPATPAAPRPVMVYIHGGANAVGTATDPMFDGLNLVTAGDVLVVTVNYRVGQLGFIAHPALAVEGIGSGDFGLLDQILALRWVHDNIAGFGGDPTNVTIFGESAGARDVCSLVASPLAAGLFQRSLMESGSCGALPLKAAAEATGEQWAAAAGCGSGAGSAADVASCMRALPVATVIATLPPDPSILVSTLYQPAIDGSVQLGEPQTVIAAGMHNKGAFVVGANADETGKAAPQVPDEATYDSLVDQQFGSNAPAVLQQYPLADFATPRDAYVRVTTDARFVCPARGIARAVLAGQTDGDYRYFFAYSLNAFGAFHGIELPFVFGNFGAITGANGQPYQPTTADLAVSAAVQADWLSFAKGGAPTGSPAWPLYTAADPAREYDATPTVVTGIRTTDCDFWATLEGTSD